MIIDNILLDNLTAQASPRLRMNLDLRNSDADSSQRMLNALEPGTVLPIHRHCSTSETVAILRGRAVQCSGCMMLMVMLRRRSCSKLEGPFLP